MRNTPRKRRFRQTMRGYWDKFPVSPEPYEEMIGAHLRSKTFYSKNASFGIARTLDGYVEEAKKLLEAGKAAQAQAILRRWMTVIIELMEKADKDAASTKGRGSNSMDSAGRYRCPCRGRDLRAPVFRLGRRTSHASLRIPLQEVLDDVRRQGDLRRARQAPQGELPALRQHRCGAGLDACRGEDLEEVLTVFVPAHSL